MYCSEAKHTSEPTLSTMADTDNNSSPVRDFFRGKNIFITGATGFLGMALIEKLLRACPDVGTIYVLIRPKKDKEVSARLEDITKNPVSTKPDVSGIFIFIIFQQGSGVLACMEGAY
jgi:FlaA1/EpsC-like NDP-sugar epimerase